MWDWVLELFNDLLDGLAQVIAAILKILFQGIVDAATAVLTLIPVPDFMTDIALAAGAIDPGIMFFLEMLQLDYGMGIITSAYMLRFLIRRIPVIG